MAPSVPASAAPSSRHTNNRSLDPTESGYGSADGQVPLAPVEQQSLSTANPTPASHTTTTSRSSDFAESGYESFQGPADPAPPIAPRRPTYSSGESEKRPLTMSWDGVDNQVDPVSAAAALRMPTLNTADLLQMPSLPTPSPTSPQTRQTLGNFVSQKMVYANEDGQDGRNTSTTRLLPPPPVQSQSYEHLPERHSDGGLLSGSRLGRSPSGRLPPAYGEQMD